MCLRFQRLRVAFSLLDDSFRNHFRLAVSSE
jgi:hypothetical protein